MPSAVTQMQHNLIQASNGRQESGGLFADVPVGRAMKSVTSDMPPLGQLTVDRVRRGGGRQIMEERGVEHRHMRDIGQ